MFFTVMHNEKNVLRICQKSALAYVGLLAIEISRKT
jgi:hypothetical protein